MQTSTAIQAYSLYTLSPYISSFILGAYSLCTLSPYISSFILGVEVPVPLILPAQLNQWEE